VLYFSSHDYFQKTSMDVTTTKTVYCDGCKHVFGIG
jgi:hypothetical protein